MKAISAIWGLLFLALFIFDPLSLAIADNSPDSLKNCVKVSPFVTGVKAPGFRKKWGTVYKFGWEFKNQCKNDVAVSYCIGVLGTKIRWLSLMGNIFVQYQYDGRTLLSESALSYASWLYSEPEEMIIGSSKMGYLVIYEDELHSDYVSLNFNDVRGSIDGQSVELIYKVKWKDRVELTKAVPQWSTTISTYKGKNYIEGKQPTRTCKGDLPYYSHFQFGFGPFRNKSKELPSVGEPAFGTPDYLPSVNAK